MVGAYWGVGSWWALVFVVCWGAWLLCGVGVLGCLVNLGGVVIGVLLRPGVVVGGWWCSVEMVLGKSGRAMNLGRAL